MLLDFQFFAQDVPGFLIFAVESRLKTFESATVKARELGIPVTELHDLAGARIVGGTSQEVDSTKPVSGLSNSDAHHVRWVCRLKRVIRPSEL